MLVALAVERLTKKQKHILIYLKSHKESANATNLVALLSKELRCAQTTVWNNVRSLKRAGLIVYGSRNGKSSPVRLLRCAHIISEKLQEVHNESGQAIA